MLVEIFFNSKIWRLSLARSDGRRGARNGTPLRWFSPLSVCDLVAFQLLV